MKLKHLLEKQNEKGLYAAVKFSNETIDNIMNYCNDSNIPNVLDPSDLHSTLCYSRKPVPDFKPVFPLEETGKPKSFEIWDSPANAFKKEATRCLVLKYDSAYMVSRFNEIQDMGATYDYDEYKPHVTLSYDVGDDFTLDTLSPPSNIGELQIVGEYSEELDLDKTF